MHVITLEFNVLFNDLQGLMTLMSQQSLRLNDLVDTYCSMGQMERPLEYELDNTDPKVSKKRSFIMILALVRSCINSLFCWVFTAMKVMQKNIVDCIVAFVVTLSVSLLIEVVNFLLIGIYK